MSKPKCFGVFRSPQSDAENDCVSCPLDRNCMYSFAYAAGLERAAEIADIYEGSSMVECADDPCRAAACDISYAIRAEKETTND